MPFSWGVVRKQQKYLSADSPSRAVKRDWDWLPFPHLLFDPVHLTFLMARIYQEEWEGALSQTFLENGRFQIPHWCLVSKSDLPSRGQGPKHCFVVQESLCDGHLSSPLPSIREHWTILEMCPAQLMGDENTNLGCCEHVVSHHSHAKITACLSPFFLSALPLTGRSPDPAVNVHGVVSQQKTCPLFLSGSAVHQLNFLKCLTRAKAAPGLAQGN